ELTELFMQDLTAIATLWTPTFTPTFTPTPTFTASATATRTASPTPTATATDTVTPSATASLTASATPTSTPSATATPTKTFTASFTPSQTATPTATATATLGVRQIAIATRDAIATLTATQWTPTPTPNLTQTLMAELTALYNQDLTATATFWTPTNTSTPRPTVTPTRTLIPSPTSTMRPTQTAIPIAITSCPGVRESQLAPGMEGFVLPDDVRSVNVRLRPGTEFDIVARLQVGESFSVLEGPTCTPLYAWFRVRGRSGTVEGWLAEGDAEAYFVAPVGYIDPTLPEGLLSMCQVEALYDFESDDPTRTSAWFKQTTDRYVADVFAGAYVLQVNRLEDGSAGDPQGEDGPALWGSLQGEENTFGDVTVEAVLRSSIFNAKSVTRTGLWVRYQDNKAFISVMLRGDGRYRVAHFTDNGYDDLIPWTQSNAINTGDGVRNTLRVAMDGDDFDVVINGQYVDSFTDDSYPTGRVAFWGASLDTPVIFELEYFRVCAQ
ncbi:MAG: SH3 domain-containing protein, partial [Armatimonadetes bacterium]|nr:SH3 domain-containing protein [Anaerolineae bacterium]